MNINNRSSKKGKDKIHDLIHQDKKTIGDPKKMVFMSNGTNSEQNNERELKIVTSNNEPPLDIRLDARVKEAIEYNEQVLEEVNQQTKYSTDITLRQGLVLIKLFKQLPLMKVGSSEMYKALTAIRPKASGQGYTTVDDPLPYSSVGVIINIDPTITEESLEKGNIVMLPNESLFTVFVTERVAVFERQVRFPLKMFSLDHSVVDSTNFEGYVLVPASAIAINMHNYNPNA